MFWIENDESLTELPRNIVEEMRSLRTFRVLNCNLSSLPAKMENLIDVVSVDLSYNKLQKFDVDILKWKSIMHLNLKFNNISEYDEESMWNHPTLAALWVNSNKHFRMPRTLTMKSPSLYYLVITNNSLTFPEKFGSEQMPVLTFLYAGGNNLGSAGLPENFDTLSNQLVHLDISRCRLLELPLYLSTFANLFYLDVRNNRIKYVDDELRTMLASKNMYNRALFSSNPVCYNGTKGAQVTINCDEMCSIYCNYKDWREDELYPHGAPPYYCDPRCNSQECYYDGGDCLHGLIEP